VFAAVLTILLGLFQAQAPQTGTVVGVVKLPDSPKTVQAAKVMLLPPKYTEIWNKQAQTRIDNYWEVFKPDFATNKERFIEFDRAAQIESFRYVMSNMRRDLGEAATRLIKDGSSTGQFQFIEIPLGTYQLLVLASMNGKDVIWSKTVEVKSDIPIFVDLGKPVS
jgi:hypothetical protein